jgi:hypothetical protein
MLADPAIARDALPDGAGKERALMSTCVRSVPRLGTAVLVGVTLLLAGCGFGRGEVALDKGSTSSGSPTALAGVPQNITEARLEVANGGFGEDRLVLQQDEPTVLHVVNGDDQAYRFQVVPDLVAAKEIAPAKTTDVEFTTANAGAYEGQLLAAAGEDVIDKIEVVVQAPGGATSS